MLWALPSRHRYNFSGIQVPKVFSMSPDILSYPPFLALLNALRAHFSQNYFTLAIERRHQKFCVNPKMRSKNYQRIIIALLPILWLIYKLILHFFHYLQSKLKLLPVLFPQCGKNQSGKESKQCRKGDEPAHDQRRKSGD